MSQEEEREENIDYCHCGQSTWTGNGYDSHDRGVCLNEAWREIAELREKVEALEQAAGLVKAPPVTIQLSSRELELLRYAMRRVKWPDKDDTQKQAADLLNRLWMPGK